MNIIHWMRIDLLCYSGVERQRRIRAHMEGAGSMVGPSGPFRPLTAGDRHSVFRSCTTIWPHASNLPIFLWHKIEQEWTCLNVFGDRLLFEWCVTNTFTLKRPQVWSRRRRSCRQTWAAKREMKLASPYHTLTVSHAHLFRKATSNVLSSNDALW